MKNVFALRMLHFALLLPMLFVIAACSASEDDDAGLNSQSDVSITSSDVESTPDATQGEDVQSADVVSTQDAGPSPDVAGPVSPLCQFGGQGTQTSGAECGCPEDCEGASPFCGRDPDDLFGPAFCTSTCENGGDCDADRYCFDDFAPLLPGFCAECGDDDVAALGESCRCDSECQAFEGQSADCLNEECTLTQCIPFFPDACPDSFNCELSLLDLTTVCVECLQESPAEEFAECNCELDCGSGLKCIDEQCRNTCNSDAECNEDQECNSAALGESLCAPIPDGCDDTQEKGIGETCVCNAECGDTAPSCVNIQFGLNVCTVRPCNVFGASDECPVPEGGNAGDWVCCGAALTFEPTCVPQIAAAQLASFAQCSE